MAELETLLKQDCEIDSQMLEDIMENLELDGMMRKPSDILDGLPPEGAEDYDDFD